MSNVSAPPASVADVLRAAAEAYRTGAIAWSRGFYLDAAGCRCALGGIAWAINPNNYDGDPRFAGPHGREAANFLAEHLVNELGAVQCGDEFGIDAIETVGGWNDEPGRTLAEVVNALEAAAGFAESVSA